MPPFPVIAPHPLLTAPHRTMWRLSLPVMASLVVESIAGPVDTASVERLGPASASGLGATTARLSSSIWMFNFLGIATQTEVARAAGVGLQRQGGAIAGLSPGLAIGIGTLVGLVTLPALPAAARFMSADAALDGSRRRTVRLTPTYVYWSEFVDNERNIYRAPRCGCP